MATLLISVLTLLNTFLSFLYYYIAIFRIGVPAPTLGYLIEVPLMLMMNLAPLYLVANRFNINVFDDLKRISRNEGSQSNGIIPATIGFGFALLLLLRWSTLIQTNIFK